MSAAVDVRTAAVVGAGAIGCSWTALFLAKGLDVAATDPRPGAEAELRSFIAQAWPALEDLGLAPGASPDRLRFSGDLEDACAGADFVQENASEDEALKVQLMARIDAAVRPEAPIASSSSALTVTTMQQACAHPERVVLGHPFNPPHLLPLVEVAGGEKTSVEALDRAEAFYVALGKTPVRLHREVYGHIANRLQAAVFREAVHLLETGVASLTDIDTAMTQGPGLRWALMGPFLTFHLAGGQGGMRHFMRQFAPMQTRIWADLGTPDIDDPMLQQRVITAMDEALNGRTIDDLAADRDRRFIGLLGCRNAVE